VADPSDTEQPGLRPVQPLDRDHQVDSVAHRFSSQGSVVPVQRRAWSNVAPGATPRSPYSFGCPRGIELIIGVTGGRSAVPPVPVSRTPRTPTGGGAGNREDSVAVVAG
ncbi:MAG: hypothetical protein ACRDQ5_27915, partial [Sciscionella sp.]